MVYHGKMIAIVLLIATFGAIQPGFARPLSTLTTTSNALPLLESVPIRGIITQIDGSEVQLQLPDQQMRTYRIPRRTQEQFGLAVGSEITLHVRRLNQLVTAIDSPTFQTGETP
ncbi:hypothetical protein HJG54_31500 [Leptolyngbya sp. NK1-12]|uniref:Uncharacterized protein n=1 Tax=Leptolyngbya sp. NK1-12 TaxID=2547451 RepID=A0AA96WQH5_9CYAN|nr:hypothetical protein [Leptolyngbya sp. NK1-12]MBF2046985.1 hypothetical protein [Elainella sp. C42_A2020_010]RNJ66657.1 MAG: hypothetical protein EDM05_24770 [Leptolyngbya sp. IPPAS B-1204]WNZ27411.1 hypothetical protein HJG54_31500 [Leptolyngbya sp. NK1-12]